jgi:2'-5' RNA ligase
MRYVIVCLIKGEALDYHENLVTDICNKFSVKRQKLPAHFTIKAPFETDNIDEVEKLTEGFCLSNVSSPIELINFGRFKENVVFMDVKTSKEAVETHDKYIDILKTIPWLEWKRNEGKGRVFHCTLVSKIPIGKFNDIWNYISNLHYHFKTDFNNISILIWEKDRWVTHKEYVFKNRT